LVCTISGYKIHLDPSGKEDGALEDVLRQHGLDLQDRQRLLVSAGRQESGLMMMMTVKCGGGGKCGEE
jgi:hypothetical protein